MKMSTLMAVSRRRESKLVSEDIAVLTVPWDLVLTGTRVLKTEKVPIQGVPRRKKTPFFLRLPKLSLSQLGNFSPIKSVDINSGGPRGQY